MKKQTRDLGRTERAVIELPVLVDAHARGVTVGPDNALDVLRSALKANGSGMHRATGT